MKALVKYSYLDERDERSYAQQEIDIPTDRKTIIDAAMGKLMNLGIAPHDFEEMKFEWDEVHIPVLEESDRMRMQIAAMEDRLQQAANYAKEAEALTKELLQMAIPMLESLRDLGFTPEQEAKAKAFKMMMSTMEKSR